ncbi:hypothetical protein ACK6U2_25360, partial [Citrobacter braakii]|uniref:hypothetical protein n=1 Tax=Citrobacter braakii TaxID=57706 RepID=UPI003C2C8C95
IQESPHSVRVVMPVPVTYSHIYDFSSQLARYIAQNFLRSRQFIFFAADSYEADIFYCCLPDFFATRPRISVLFS